MGIEKSIIDQMSASISSDCYDIEDEGNSRGTETEKRMSIDQEIQLPWQREREGERERKEMLLSVSYLCTRRKEQRISC